MRPFIVVLVVIMASLLCKAAAQCKVRKQTDEFTNKTTYFTDKVKIFHGGLGSLIKSSEDYTCTYNNYVRFIAGSGEIYLSIIEDADKCMCAVTAMGLKFENGAVLTKKMTKQGNEVNSLLGTETYTFYLLTKEELKQLAENTIVKFRFQEEYCPDHPKVEKEIREKAAEDIRQSAKCILDEIN